MHILQKTSFVVSLSLLIFTAAASNLIPDGDNPWNSPEVRTVEVDGKSVFSLATPATTVYSSPIPIDPAKRYRLSGKLRSASADNPSVSCFGLVMLNNRGLRLTMSNVNAVEGSETVLAEAAAKDATRVVIKNGDNWEKRRSVRSLVAFNVKEDYSDLPNFDLSGLIERVRRSADGENWDVSLSRPLTRDYPAGTAVRQHLYGVFLNCCLAYGNVRGEWTEFSAEIGGLAKAGAPPDQFWNGTVAVTVLIMADAGRKGAELQFADIVFEEISN